LFVQKAKAHFAGDAIICMTSHDLPAFWKLALAPAREARFIHLPIRATQPSLRHKPDKMSPELLRCNNIDAIAFLIQGSSCAPFHKPQLCFVMG
jgi:hypothetical protein